MVKHHRLRVSDLLLFALSLIDMGSRNERHKGDEDYPQYKSVAGLKAQQLEGKRGRLLKRTKNYAVVDRIGEDTVSISWNYIAELENEQTAPQGGKFKYTTLNASARLKYDKRQGWHKI
jgi:hypothetical protein